ncbi:carbon monoxide dehydrogenase subunit G [Aestuariivita sp.]|uniref:CoxG family protein n=1 Tax=Aestuariivita sp. TaxID=1872407 RepID=UPI00216FB4B1|nr:carbon monoxide dehydrogenase subunit G [Aestuariivita sp.]MCE8009175.1 carbon monoxide dehydrogenase subunit G [Aestuariivita sp.]
MKMQDQREIKAAREVVFAAILDPEVLKDCIPGASEVTGSVSEGYNAVVTQKVGPVKATFKGQVQMSDIVENEAITITGEGKGGAAGFAKGGAVVTLEEIAPELTRLSYDVEAKVGGKLAQLGSRIIDGFAKKMADQFFSNLQDGLEGPSEEEADEDAPKKGWFKRLTGKS